MDLLYEHEVNYISSTFSDKRDPQFKIIEIDNHDYFFNPDPKGQFENIRCYDLARSSKLLINPDTQVKYDFTV